MKRLLAILLSVVMLLGCVVVSTAAEDVSPRSGEYIEAPVDNTATSNPYWHQFGFEDNSVVFKELGLLVSTNASFKGFEIRTENWGRDTGATFSVYEWNHDYATTVSGEAKVTTTINFVHDGFARASFDTLPKGVYLFVLNGYYNNTDNGGTVTYLYNEATSKEALVFASGNEKQDFFPAFNLVFTEEVGDYYNDPATSATYIYENSLDGSQYKYVGHEALDINTLSDELRAQFDLYANGEYNKVIGFELLASDEGVYVYRTIHNTDATVNVTGGTATKYNGYYILNAEETKDGKNFEGWYEGDKLISYKTTYKFFPDKATTEITAKYVEGEVVKKTDVQVEATRTQDKLTVKVTPMQGTGNTIKEYGYFIATSADAMDAKAVIDANRGASTTAPHVYMVRVYDIDQTTTVNQNIYLVGWIKLYDENGAYVNTIHTDLVTVTPVA